MLLKFRFKNYSCFPEWEEIDLTNYNLSHLTSSSVNICSIFGSRSSGKTSILKLLKIAIDYLRHILVYEEHVGTSLRFNNISHVFNISLSLNSRYEKFKLKEANENDDIFVTYNKPNMDQSCTFVELYFADNNFIYRYKLYFNDLYPEVEELAYTLKSEDMDDERKWSDVYKKTNISYDAIYNSSNYIFDIDVNEVELELNKKPSFKFLNHKNSLINYLKNLSKSVIISSFYNNYTNFIFFDDVKNTNIFKTYNIDKKYLMDHKQAFLDVFAELNLNIVDFKIDDETTSDFNNFNLIISKENNLNKIIYLNSRFESHSTIRLFHIIYYILKAIDNNNVLVIDEFDKYLSTNEVIYFLSWIKNTIEQNNEIKTQIIISLSQNLKNDLINVSSANHEIISDSIASKIKRIS